MVGVRALGYSTGWPPPGSLLPRGRPADERGAGPPPQRPASTLLARPSRLRVQGFRAAEWEGGPSRCGAQAGAPSHPGVS